MGHWTTEADMQCSNPSYFFGRAGGVADEHRNADDRRGVPGLLRAALRLPLQESAAVLRRPQLPPAQYACRDVRHRPGPAEPPAEHLCQSPAVGPGPALGSGHCCSQWKMRITWHGCFLPYKIQINVLMRKLMEGAFANKGFFWKKESLGPI
jgi:hypothetical protein